LIKEGKKERKVLSILPANVKVTVPEEEIFHFYPGMVTFYQDHVNAVEYLSEDGTFAYSVPSLKQWKKVETHNAFARSVLDLAKALKTKDL